MVFKSYTTQNNALHEYVDSFWYTRDEQNISGKKALPKLLSNTTPTLLLNFGDPITYKYQDGVISTQKHHLRFINTHYYEIQAHGCINIVGINLKPCSIYKLFSCDMKQKINLITELDNMPEIIGNLANFRIARGMDDEIVNIERLLTELFSISSSDKPYLNTQGFIQEINELVASKQYQMDCIYKNIAIPERTLQRQFLRVVGISPSKYLQINRFLSLILEVKKLDDQIINWSDLSCEFGFYDQAHFINVFKQYTGSSPLNYIRKKDLLLDLYGGKT